MGIFDRAKDLPSQRGEARSDGDRDPEPVSTEPEPDGPAPDEPRPDEPDDDAMSGQS